MNLIRERSIGTCAFLAKIAVLFGILALAAFGVFGCATGPDGGIYIDETVWVYVTNRVDSVAGGSVKGGGASSGAAEPPSSTVAAQGDVGELKVVLDFRYGGFKGGGAKEDPRCRIGSPKITKDKISWKWETKIPSDWKRGSTSKGPMVISAAFYWDEAEKKWIGGKMDWCDEARTSRACNHIHDGYNGWKSAGWDAAKKRAYCVVSADGKWRSNLIED